MNLIASTDQFVITNADATKFLDTVEAADFWIEKICDNPLQALHFPSQESAREKLNSASNEAQAALEKEGVVHIQPVSLWAELEIPGLREETKEDDLSAGWDELGAIFQIAHLALEDNDFREHAADSLRLTDQDLEHLDELLNDVLAFSAEAQSE